MPQLASQVTKVTESWAGAATAIRKAGSSRIKLKCSPLLDYPQKRYEQWPIKELEDHLLSTQNAISGCRQHAHPEAWTTQVAKLPTASRISRGMIKRADSGSRQEGARTRIAQRRTRGTPQTIVHSNENAEQRCKLVSDRKLSHIDVLNRLNPCHRRIGFTAALETTHAEAAAKSRPAQGALCHAKPASTPYPTTPHGRIHTESRTKPRPCL